MRADVSHWFITVVVTAEDNSGNVAQPQNPRFGLQSRPLICLQGFEAPTVEDAKREISAPGGI